MKRKKTDYHHAVPAKNNITPETLKDKRTFKQFCSNVETKQDIPLRSIYYRLYEAIEGRNVAPNTHSLYQQISMLSPQTPRNKRRCVLGNILTNPILSLCTNIYLWYGSNMDLCIFLTGVDILTNQTSDSPKQSSCLTYLTCKLSNITFCFV